MNLSAVRKSLLEANKKPKEEIVIKDITDITALNSYDPTKNPKQLQAHRSEASWLLFGGALGGGKTAWLVNEAIFHCLRYPGARAFLARYEKESFKRTTYLSLQEFLPTNLVRRENKSDSFIEFKNGSFIFYGGLGDDHRAIKRLNSLEISLWGIDQAEEVSELFFHKLNSRLRLKVEGLKKYRGLLTCNPTAGWIRERFLDNEYKGHEFIPSLPSENPFLPSDYIDRLRQSLPPGLVEIWLSGNWDAISSEDKIFPIEAVSAAMKRRASKEGQPIVACDPARMGTDETVIVKKQGNHISFIDIFSKKSTMETCGKIIRAAKRNKETRCKVEAIGLGGGIADRLREQGYRVVEVIGSQSAKQGHVYKNARAENYFNLKKLLPTLSIPNDSKLKKEMLSVRYRMFSDGRVMVETKEEMRKRGLPSPNRLDALVTVCAEEPKVSESELEALLPFQRNPLQKAVSRLLHFKPSLRRAKTIDERAKETYSPAQLEILQREKIEVIGYTPPIRMERRRPTPPAEEMESAFLSDGKHCKIIQR